MVLAKYKRDRGFEPLLSVWKTEVLPLHQSRTFIKTKKFLIPMKGKQANPQNLATSTDAFGVIFTDSQGITIDSKVHEEHAKHLL